MCHVMHLTYGMSLSVIKAKILGFFINGQIKKNQVRYIFSFLFLFFFFYFFLKKTSQKIIKYTMPHFSTFYFQWQFSLKSVPRNWLPILKGHFRLHSRFSPKKTGVRTLSLWIARISTDKKKLALTSFLLAIKGDGSLFTQEMVSNFILSIMYHLVGIFFISRFFFCIE